MAKLENEAIVKLLSGYRTAAENARKSAWGARDDVWKHNVDLYFSRFDFSKKADWQTKQPMPEAATFIERWSAAVRAALLHPGAWYSVGAPSTNTGQSLSELEPAFRKMLGFYLDRCGTSALGQPLGFEAVFEDQTKLAALIASAATVTWEERVIAGQVKGRVRVDAIDPREVLLDPTYRGVFRGRCYEIDYADLLGMTQADPSLWDMEAIKGLKSYHDKDTNVDRSGLAGHGVDPGADRKVIKIEEWYARLTDENGEDAYGDKQLVIVANDITVIRGPERNPYTHGMDWVVFAPAIRVPLSVYGKTYVETWGDLADTFVMLTNLIIDAAKMAALNAYAVNKDALDDPNQLADGISPNMTLLTANGYSVEDLIREVPLGNLSPSAVQVWTAIRQEMREGASTNDLDLGQAVPKGEVTATEINAVQRGSTELLQAIAASLEVGCVDVMLSLIFLTALQHFSEDDVELKAAIGERYFNMFVANRGDFIRLAPAFRARGISGLIEKRQKLQQMLQVLQLMSTSPQLLQLLTQVIGLKAFIRQIITLIGLDPNEFPPEPTANPMGAGPGGAPGGSPPRAPTPPTGQ